MDILTIILIVSLLFLSFARRGEMSVKIWKRDYDIRNPRNWVGGKAQTQCDGLDLSKTVVTIIAKRDLIVKKITLPLHLKIKLTDNVHIEFDENSSDVMNCAQLVREVPLNNWQDLSSWILQDDEENVAVPHYERVPCKYDDVVFPKAFESGYCLVTQEVEIKSLKFGSDYLESEDFERGTNLFQLAFVMLQRDMIHILDEPCMDPNGCLCRNDEVYSKDICWHGRYITHYSCLKPIKPIGFCTEMCGASILVKPKSNFQITSVKKYLKDYSSDTYVSKVLNGSEEVIQIIFAEKQFIGTSIDEATTYFSQLLADGTVEIESAELYSSGPNFVEEEITRNSLSIVFGSLCGVVLFFAILFLVYSPQFAALNLRNRYLLASRPLTRFTGTLFARFDNTENAELIMERHSLAGSVISLDKSFDNPMYGKSTPSTASTSYGTIDIPEEKVTKSEVSVENPMYDITNLDATAQEITEGDLVDLTGNK